MKLPHHLLRTYRRYKEEEQELLLWIESAAAASGHGPQVMSAKKKSRGRRNRPNVTPKLDCDIRSTATGNSSEGATISILEILAPVAAIAQNPAITIPSKVADQFATIISLRKACVGWFKSNTPQYDAETRKKNQMHTLPLELLIEAVGLLKPRFPLQKTKSSKQKANKVSPTTAETIEDIFSRLSMEEGNEATMTSMYTEVNDKSTPIRTHIRKISQATKDEQIQDEFKVALYCMLRDIQEVEDFVVLEVVRYSRDRANADALPSLTNLAIDIVARMEAALYESFGRYGFEQALLDKMFCPSPNVLPDSPTMRMRAIIKQQAERVDKDSDIRRFQQDTSVFNPEFAYFTSSPHQQILAEAAFVRDILYINSTNKLIGGLISHDLTSRIIEDLLPQLLCDDNNCFIPIGAAFGVRIALLTLLLLGEQLHLFLNEFIWSTYKLTQSANAREDLWRTPRYQSERARTLWGRTRDDEAQRQLKYNTYHFLIQESSLLLSSHPLMCALNSSMNRLEYAGQSLEAMELSNVVMVLAHLWNLLQEEDYLHIAWTDAEYLAKVLGEEYLFQSSRPTRSLGSAALRSRVVYGMGYRKSFATQHFGRSDLSGVIVDEFCMVPRFKFSMVALPVLLCGRSVHPGQGLTGGPDRATDAELIIAATTLPGMLGQKPHPVRLVSGCQLGNRDKLWKHRDQKPNIQPVELLALAKKRLLQDYRLASFDYLKFEQATLDFVETLVEELDILRRIPALMPPGTTDITVAEDSAPYSRLMVIMHEIVTSDTTSPLLPRIAEMFQEWLETNGHIGVKTLNVVEQRPVSPNALLSSLRPDVLTLVKDIVKRRGLREDVFSSDQIDVEGIEVTGTIEDTTRGIWADFKTKRKTAKR